MDLKLRTRNFAVDAIRFASRLPGKPEFGIIGRQLMRCASSVGANYRSSQRAKSRKDFVAKLAIVEEEADESLYWIELLEQVGFTENEELQRLKDEANQLVAIMVASKKKARTSC